MAMFMENYKSYNSKHHDSSQIFNEVIFMQEMEVMFTESSNALVDMNAMYDYWDKRAEEKEKIAKTSFMAKVNGAWVVVKEKLIEFLKKIWGYIMSAYKFILKFIDKIKDPKFKIKKDIQNISDNIVVSIIANAFATIYKGKDAPPSFSDFIMNKQVQSTMYDVVILLSMKENNGLTYVCDEFLREMEAIQHGDKDSTFKVYFDKLKDVLFDIEKLIESNETDVKKIQNIESYLKLKDFYETRIKSINGGVTIINNKRRYNKCVYKDGSFIRANVPETWDEILGYLAKRRINDVTSIIESYKYNCIYVRNLYLDIVAEVAIGAKPKERQYNQIKSYISEISSISSNVKSKFDIWLKDKTNSYIDDDSNIMSAYAEIHQELLAQLFFIGKMAKESAEDICTIEAVTEAMINRYSIIYKTLFYTKKGVDKVGNILNKDKKEKK